MTSHFADPIAITPFINGALMVAHVVAGMAFLRFWSRTRDRLFLMFCIAFWSFAANRLLLTLLDIPNEHQIALYVVRLAGFSLILVAIIDKNRKHRVGPRSPA
jgi:hypothetical protein